MLGLTLSPAINNGPRCSMCTALDGLEASQRAVVDGWLDDPGIQGSQIARSLRAEKINVSAQTVTRHRRGECADGRLNRQS